MKKFTFIMFFLITACSQNTYKSNVEISDKMSFLEFKKELEKYAINSPYPNIDK